LNDDQGNDGDCEKRCHATIARLKGAKHKTAFNVLKRLLMGKKFNKIRWNTLFIALSRR